MEEPMKEPVKAKTVDRIHCGNCEDQAYACDNCKECFREGEEIICIDSEHFCNMECYNDWKTAAPLVLPTKKQKKETG